MELQASKRVDLDSDFGACRVIAAAMYLASDTGTADRRHVDVNLEEL